ncbi:MAG: HAMP domain-containing histidine kinase [Methanomicrobiales archaeon]|nr:HAMP domain-containing histidine kinase [Methanomicrobiales archaeon]
MWTPDIRTIFLVIFLINAFLALMLFFCYKSQKTYDGFAIWASSLLLQSFAYLLFFLRGEVPALLSILAANTLTVLGIMIRIDAIRRFFWSRTLPEWHYLLLLPVLGSFAYFTYVADSMVLRAALSTLFIVPVLIVAAIVPLRVQDAGTRMIRYLFSASLALPGIVLSLRIIAWLIVPAEYSLFSTDLFNTAFFIAAIIGDILATGCFLMLNMLRLHKELTQANEKLGLLSSITRHDISNQLVALAGFLELSKQCGDREGHGQELIEKEMKIVNTITHQIQFTGDYERMGVPEPEWQNVGATVRKAAAALPVRNIGIRVERQDLEVLADPLFFKVFYNLLDNSLRYGGAGMKNIKLTSRETPDGLLLVYEDDGTGIADADRKRLFDRGFGKHTGLGLFLSREVLAITGITIAERGEPGNGACFEMLVPNGAYRFSTMA